MPTIFSFTLSDRLTKAAEQLGASQGATAAEYVEGIVKHVLRGQAAKIAAEDAQAVLAAYDAADNSIQRQVRDVLGIQGLR